MSSADPPPWPPDFPAVLTHTTLDVLYGAALRPDETLPDAGRSPMYEAAKGGDAAAANLVVRAVIKPEVVEAMAAKYPSAVVVSVHAEEAAGRNKLPQMYALAIGDIGGLRVDDEIVQTNRTRHTGATARQRLSRSPTFFGTVHSGEAYIVVDDVVATGSSIAALRHFIEAAGGRVVLATTLAAAKARWGQEPTQLAITQHTVSALERKFDVVRLNAILRDHGTAPTTRHLTEAQGRTLLGFGSIDAIRSCLASGRQA